MGDGPSDSTSTTNHVIRFTPCLRGQATAHQALEVRLDDGLANKPYQGSGFLVCPDITFRAREQPAARTSRERLSVTTRSPPRKDSDIYHSRWPLLGLLEVPAKFSPAEQNPGLLPPTPEGRADYLAASREQSCDGPADEFTRLLGRDRGHGSPPGPLLAFSERTSRGRPSRPRALLRY